MDTKYKLFAVPDSIEYSSDNTAISSTENGRHMPVVRKKERDYEGMIEFKKEDIPVIIRHLVAGKINFKQIQSYTSDFTKNKQFLPI